MQTTKLISSISFNTEKFLTDKLNHLVYQGILEYAHFIEHKPEDDEKKNHFHIVVKPNKRLDTSALRNEFLEFVPGEKKPLCVLPFRSTSRLSDWILYCAHDTLYLLKKQETRTHHYEKSDFKSTDEDLFDEDWRECHKSADSHIPTLKNLAKQGVSWVDVLSMGFLPVNQLFQYKEIFFAFASDETNRGGRMGHDEI